MGIDHAKGPKIPKTDMYGRPIQDGQQYDMTGKPMGQDYAGPHMDKMIYSGKGQSVNSQAQFDANGQPVNVLAKNISKLVLKIFLVSGVLMLALMGGVFYLIFSLLSGPSGAAEEYLINLPDVAAESASFHYGNINNDTADLVGNYKKDGKSYPVWVNLSKIDEEWVVTDFANTPPQDVIDSMNDDVEFDN